MEVTAQKLENGESAEEVLQNMAESLLADAAGAEVSGSNVTSSSGDVANQVVRTDGLAEVRILLTKCKGPVGLRLDTLMKLSPSLLNGTVLSLEWSVSHQVSCHWLIWLDTVWLIFISAV